MAKSGDRIKFRCFKCDKLLGVSRSKAGSTVPCPQCGAELVIPDGRDDLIEVDEPDPAQVFRNLVDTQAPAAPVSAPAAAASAFPVSIEPVAPPPAVPPFVAIRTEAPAPAIDPVFPVIRTEPAPKAPAPAPVATFPTIRAEPEAVRAAPAPERAPSERAITPRRNDVVMPRTALVLWSFFALLALVSAFTAGLLAGHFLWARPA